LFLESHDLVLTTFISIPHHVLYQYQSVYQSRPAAQVLPYQTAQTLHRISNANYMSTLYKVSKPFKNFLSKLFAVLVEQNRCQTTSVSNLLPIYTITVSPSIRLILTFCSIYKLLLDFLSRQSIQVSFAICINLVPLDCQMPSASLRNKHTISQVCPQFVVISLSASFCPSLLQLIFSSCILSFLSFF
jgi:hypothetical protein